MTKEREALLMALVALEKLAKLGNGDTYGNSIGNVIAQAATTAIQEALAQPEQEPVLWVTPDGSGWRMRLSPPVNDVAMGWTALYTTSPKRKEWVGLTDEWVTSAGAVGRRDLLVARAIEAKLKELNHD
jgi:hypothetical protein